MLLEKNYLFLDEFRQNVGVRYMGGGAVMTLCSDHPWKNNCEKCLCPEEKTYACRHIEDVNPVEGTAKNYPASRAPLQPESAANAPKDEEEEKSEVEIKQISSEDYNESLKVHKKYGGIEEVSPAPVTLRKTSLTEMLLAWLLAPEQVLPECLKSAIAERSCHPDTRIDPRMRIHIHADSLFSTTSGFNNYRGLLNLGVILLSVTMGRIALENVLKYGILVDPIVWARVFLEDPWSWPSFMLFLFINIFGLSTFFLEILLSKDLISERTGLCCYVSLLATHLLFPVMVVLQMQPAVLSSSITLLIYTCTFLKLVSYAQVNRWCRFKQNFINQRLRYRSMSSRGSLKELAEEDDEDLSDMSNGNVGSQGDHRPRFMQQYPNNLYIKDFAYFMCAPTLCYELNFPRSARIRKRFLAKRFVEMMFLFGLLLSLVQQWIVPSIENSLVPFKDLHWLQMFERLLKLSVPNHLVWLIFFYWFFHSVLNVLAELLRFADRVFYRDWWNAPTIQYFWSNWNIPVHRWASRHVYKPMLSAGFSKLTASMFVFFISAFFHEFLVSVPLRMFRLWAFSAMLGQVPLAMFVNKVVKDEKYGNMIVWLSLIIGQPAAILMYYHDYYVLNNT